MMFSKERVELTQELMILLADYWNDVDTNWGRNAGDYYTDDAIFESSKNTYNGKAKIQQFYQWRIDRGVNRTAVHSFANFRAIPTGPNVSRSSAISASENGVKPQWRANDSFQSVVNSRACRAAGSSRSGRIS